MALRDWGLFAAARFTRGVDILIRRGDFARVTEAMEAAGFRCRHIRKVDMFLDGPNARAVDAVHVLFAGERVGKDDPLPTPSLDDIERTATFRVIGLEPLVGMKLVSYRDKDRTHLRDMIDVGLIDASWPQRFPAPLDERLQGLLDDPDG